jgi:hypothetical protein
MVRRAPTWTDDDRVRPQCAPGQSAHGGAAIQLTRLRSVKEEGRQDMASKNHNSIGVIGMDEFNSRYLLKDLRDTDDIEFHTLLDRDEISIVDSGFPFEERLNTALKRARAVDGGIDGVVTHWDFPSTMITPLLAEELGTPYATPEAVMKCEHKLWSRQEEKKVTKTPGFCGFHPFSDDPLAEIDLDYPFWVKPVVGHSSMLGFEIRNGEDFDAALAEIREHITELTRPFRYALEHIPLPEKLAEQGATLCIAEEIISREDQFTLEGYAHDGQVEIYGVIDSIREPNGHTFSHYQYPTQADQAVVARMEDITRKVIHQIGYKDSPFNIEFFYNPETDHLHLLEINSRVSQSHSDLFLKVDGQPNQQIAVDLALGRTPRWRRGAGEFDMAAKFFLRCHEDARVEAVPTEAMLQRLEREMPDVRVDIGVEPGQRLSELHEQESYSYEIADLFIGGRDAKELDEKYEACNRILQFEFSPV